MRECSPLVIDCVREWEVLRSCTNNKHYCSTARSHHDKWEAVLVYLSRYLRFDLSQISEELLLLVTIFSVLYYAALIVKNLYYQSVIQLAVLGVVGSAVVTYCPLQLHIQAQHRGTNYRLSQISVSVVNQSQQT